MDKKSDKNTTISVLFDADARRERDARLREVHWFAVCCVAQHERKLVERLLDPKFNPLVKSQQGEPFDAYVPVKEEIRQWSDRKKRIAVVQTPGIIFVRTSLRDKNQLFAASDKKIRWFFCQPGKSEPSPIGDCEMQLFMTLTKEAEEVSLTDAEPRVGDYVRLTSGKMKGYVFELLSLDAPSGTGRQKARLRLLLNTQMASTFSVEASQIIKVDSEAHREFIDSYYSNR